MGRDPDSTEWKGTKVVDVYDKEMAMNITIITGSLVTTDEEYFMNGQDYLKLLRKQTLRQPGDGPKVYLIMMYGMPKSRYHFLPNC